MWERCVWLRGRSASWWRRWPVIGPVLLLPKLKTRVRWWVKWSQHEEVMNCAATACRSVHLLSDLDNKWRRMINFWNVLMLRRVAWSERLNYRSTLCCPCSIIKLCDFDVISFTIRPWLMEFYLPSLSLFSHTVNINPYFIRSYAVNISLPLMVKW